MEELLQSIFTGWGEGRRWRSYCSPSLLYERLASLFKKLFTKFEGLSGLTQSQVLEIA